MISLATGQSIDLTGRWDFALDPLGRGEAVGWHEPWRADSADPAFLGGQWDQVTVPHCWSIDPRYAYTGKVWYRRGFFLSGAPEGRHARLRFDAVFYRCRVWVNGNLAGAHEGGYTPFELDVAEWLRPDSINFVSTEVDNSWDMTTIPGSNRRDAHPRRMVYPWWEYGGITRPLRLELAPTAYLSKQKIDALPNLESGSAELRVTTWIRKTGDTPREITPEILLRGPRDTTPFRTPFTDVPSLTLGAGETRSLTLRTTLSPPEMELWYPDHPRLYELTTRLSEDGSDHRETFGIRRVEVTNSQLLLNGEVIRLAGTTRHADHPAYGSMDPDTVAWQDMGLMKEANLQLSRLAYYARKENFLDWADQYGHIIAEADPVMRENWQNQHREMVERDWNRLSLIAWSVGNEYDSWTDAGDDWTRDMIDHTGSLDSTRLFTFAAIGEASRPDNLVRGRNSLSYVDFISYNNYGNVSGLDRIFARYPKPVLVTEFGHRATDASPEARNEYLTGYTRAIRQRPLVIGTAWWSFSDYRSRYPGTSPDGYREWGLVDARRVPRPLYDVAQREFAPAVLEAETDRTETRVTLTVRDDYPRQPLRNYGLCYTATDGSVKRLNLPDLMPGDVHTITVAAKPGTPLELQRPQGFTVVKNVATNLKE